ncbi:MAG TPA: protein phosphatase 2C domain-containing protein [Candidatus Binatia bacterium]|nr:protein phosphatase 2C domain-containing protein [Candidatus Binatia bacterium]
MWRLFTASVRGAAHISASLPNQDAVSVQGHPAEEGREPLAVAVADGHGDPRHFRSGRGSQLAVEVACALASQFAADVDGVLSPAALRDRLRDRLVPAVVDGWRAAVLRDLEADPLAPEERAQTGARVVVAYGSTLLLAVLAGQRVMIAQIGDGDVLAVERSGRAVSPLPPDPWIHGRFTTSLCQEDPLASFRVAVLDLDTTPLALLLLATDGFANSQVNDPWYEQFGTDLLGLLTRYGADWVGAHLPEWAASCASTAGSGDDTTLALLVDSQAPR